MKKILSTKTFFWTLLISIIGSALLENIFRNIFNFIGKTALTISTLGIEKYKNDIYLNIARGFYEQVSLKVLSLEVGVLSGGYYRSGIFKF